MNIGMHQLLPNVKAHATKAIRSEANVMQKTPQKFEAKNTDKFGTVFKQAIDAQSTDNSSAVSSDKATMEKVLHAKTLEELFDLLNIEHDNGLLMIQAGEEGQAIATDELLNLEHLLAVLNMDAEQLQQLVKDLLEEDKQVTDLWDMLAFVQENAPVILKQLTSSDVQGEQKIMPKQSEQLIQLLKLAELAGKVSDLTKTQENQLTAIKDLLTQAIGQMQKTTETTTSKVTLLGFQQVTKKQESTDANLVVQAPTTQKVETFTITLPASKPAQSEAFLKEMQALLNKAQVANVAGMTKLAIKLYPENLGSIRIELVQQNGVLTARLLASTALGRELLDQHAHQLKQAFVQQNIQVERLDIAQALQNPERNTRDQNFMNNAFNQQQDDAEEQQEENNEESMSFSDYLINEEV